MSSPPNEKAVILLIVEQRRRQAVEIENTRLRARLAELINSDKHRLQYSTEQRDSTTGRHVGVCTMCGHEGIVKARGFCPRCYLKFYRARKPKPLGTQPVRYQKVSALID